MAVPPQAAADVMMSQVAQRRRVHVMRLALPGLARGGHRRHVPS